MRHVLNPVDQPFSPEVAAVLARYPQGKDGHIIQLFRVFANSMRFLTGKGALNLLDKQSPLSLREREIVILRVTANLDCEYEWGVHVTTFASAAELTEQQIAATRLAGSDAGCWNAAERVLIACVDQLCKKAVIDAVDYDRFQKIWNLEQQLEIMALCGNYHLISFVANCSNLSPEAGAARFS